MSKAASIANEPSSPTSVLPYATPIVDPEVDRKYRYWRVRVLATSMIGYAIFYFVRANDAVPVKAMQADLGMTKAQLGLISTLGGVTYGISKFVNGFLGDHANPRYFMAIGLTICAVMNFFFGASSAFAFLAGFWIMNMWAQGMGFPPCAKTMAYWFSPRERNSTFGIWHISHMIGAGLITIITGYLVRKYGWRSCYYVPAGIALAGVVIILIFLRDTPASLSLPPVEIYKGEESPIELATETKIQEPYWHVVRDYILTNPYMWIISTANALVYVLRWVPMKWGPTFLQEAKGISLVASAYISSGLELAGMISALLAGFVADRLFGGRAGRVCVIAMFLMVGVIYLFWITPPGHPLISTVLFFGMGFFLYIPQMLIAAIAMTLATKRAGAAAVGMTGIFGYLATIPSGWGVGWMADHYGWSGPFALMLGCAIGTMVLMAFTWNIGAHPELHKAAATSDASRSPVTKA